MENNPTGNISPGSDEGRTIALISYLTIFGWIIAYVMHSSNKTALGAYHLRQTAMLYLIAFCVWVLGDMLRSSMFTFTFIGTLLILIDIGLFILWLMGFISAINGQQKPLPLIGEKAQLWFKGIR